MKEVILYVYGLGEDMFANTEPDPIFASSFKGRVIGVKTDLPFSRPDMPKEGEVIADADGGKWLVVELCDSAMKSFQ